MNPLVKLLIFLLVPIGFYLIAGGQLMTVRASCHGLLQEEGTNEYDRLKEGLESKDQAVRRTAVQTVLASRNADHIPLLVNLLRDEDSGTRRGAMIALYELRAEKAATKIAHLVRDKDQRVAYTAAEYATKLGYVSNRLEVESLFRSPRSSSRLAGILLSASLPSEQAFELLEPHLLNGHFSYRKIVLEQLSKFDNEDLSPLAMDILRTIGQAETRGHAHKDFLERLSSIMPLKDLETLAAEEPPCVQRLVYWLLARRGVDVTDDWSKLLDHTNPQFRIEALGMLVDSGNCSEAQIIKMLQDPDSGARSFALRYASKLSYQEMAPVLRKCFNESLSGNEQEYAANALIKLGHSVFPDGEKTRPKYRLFELVEQESHANVISKQLVNCYLATIKSIQSLEGFPTPENWPKFEELLRNPIIKRPMGKISNRFCLDAPGPRNPIGLKGSLVIFDGNLILEGSISDSVVVVTGDVYARDCTVKDCVFLIQGKFTCNGYIRDSSVVVGEDQSLRVSDGYVMKSVVSAGKLSVEGYCSESLISGKVEKTGYNGPDIRNSSVFDNDVIYEKMIKIVEALDE